jgi:hypothetical protein
MSEKYLASTDHGNPAASVPTIITNDLYLAAFLHCTGCPLDHVQHNERRRMSFVFAGERVRELRQAYRTGPVKLDMRSFRESLSSIRRLMDAEQPEQRSVSHVNVNEPGLQAVPQY